MPRIDPQQLLTCLGVLLNPNGGIKSRDEVARLASLMTKYSKNLVSKCVYILILKNTETKLLGDFMAIGGWNLTHTWLTNGIVNQNWALVAELLELMLMCPVDVDRLKVNNCPKLVKGLSKEGGPEGVRVLATKLVEQWLKVVKGETQAAAATTANNSAVSSPELHNEISCEMQIDGGGTLAVPSAAAATPTVTSDVVATEEDDSTTKTVKVENECFINTTDICGDNDQLATGDDDDEIHIDQPATDPLDISDQLPVYRLKFRDGKQIITKVDESSLLKIDSDEIVTDHVKSKEKSSSGTSSTRDKERSKHSSSKHHSSSSSSSSKSAKKSSSSSHKSSSKDSRESSKSSSSSNSSSSSSSKSKSSKSLHKNSSSSKSSNSSSSDNKERQAEKDKATLAKLQPQSISKLGKIPKKLINRDNDNDGKKSVAPAPAPAPKLETKKPSISIENRKSSAEARPKTVKVFNAKMRSTGLEEEVKPPSSRNAQRATAASTTTINTTTTTTTTTATKVTKRSTSPINNSLTSLSRDHPPEKKAKIVVDSINSTNNVERPGGIKLIAPKPKPVGLQECGLFMDAMVAASTKKEPKKRKRRISTSKDDSNAPGGKTNSPPHSPINSQLSSSPTTTTITNTNTTSNSTNSITALKPTAPKFYKDTLESDDDDVKTNSDDETKKSTEDKENKNEENSAVKLDERKELERTAVPPRVPGGVLVYSKRKGPKKSVRWKNDNDLEEIQYFELDETERVNVTKTFTDMKMMEMNSERKALQLSRKLPNEDLMDEKTRWRPLIPIDLTPDLAVRGKKSKEKDIQYAREKVILPVVYFHKSMIPDSPTEPDVEHHQMEDPVIIPLDDVAGNPDNVKDFTGTPWPEAKGELPRPNVVPPIVPQQFPAMQPNFMNGPNPQFPPFTHHHHPSGGPFMPNNNESHLPMMPPAGDWRTGDNRSVMGGGMPTPGADMPMPPNMFNPMAGGMPPPNMFPPPGPDGFPNMPPNMNGPPGFPPGPPVDFQGPPPPGMGPPGMFNHGGDGFQGNPIRGGFRGRGRGGGGGGGGGGPPPGFDRHNSNWKSGRQWNNRGIICKHFQKGGYCRQGDKCQFLHPGENCPPF